MLIMKKNTVKDNFSQRVIDSMPENLNDLEKAAYIIMKIALEKSFSSEYYWSSTKLREKMYSKAIKKNNVKLKRKKQLICVTAARLFKDIAEQLGLEIYFLGGVSHKITQNNLSTFINGEHVIPILRLKDGRMYEVDLERNLDNIKTHRRWTNFCTNNHSDRLSTLSRDEIDNIMKKISYINSEQDYLDTYCEKLYKKISNYDLKRKIDTIFSEPEFNKQVCALNGSVDIYRFYRRIIRDFTIKSDGKSDLNEKIYLFGGYTKNKKRKKTFTLCAFLNEKNNKSIWIWSKNQKKMIELKPTELKYFIHKKNLKLNIPGKNMEIYNELLNWVNKGENIENVEEDIWIR